MQLKNAIPGGGARPARRRNGSIETGEKRSMIFPTLSDEVRRERLKSPAGPVEMVLDTDTDNEMDDQFALVWAMLFPEKLQVKAVTAAPFHNDRSRGPGEGMRQSLGEIQRWLSILDAAPSLAFAGSDRYLPDRNTPVDSPAARRIVELAHDAGNRGQVLYLLAIAALTNVASALLLDPSIAGHCVLVWLGGNSVNWPDNREFNLIQDVPAVQAVLDSGIPLVRIPCVHGADALITTLPELRERCAPHGKAGAALYDLAIRFMKPGDSRIIWDISTVGYLLTPEAFFSEVMPTPVLRDDASWESGAGRPEYREVRRISRDPLFSSLFERLAAGSLSPIETMELAR